MAGSAKTGVRNLIAALMCCFALPAEPTITLQQVGARKQPEYTLVNEGKSVIVSGQISTKPVRLGEIVHLAIQEAGHGLILEAPVRTFSQLSPGDWVEAHGRVTQRAGLPIVVVAKITTVSSGAPPYPVALSLIEVQNLERLGQLVITEGQVIEIGSNFGGAYLRMGNYPNTLKVFLPNPPDVRQ